MFKLFTILFIVIYFLSSISFWVYLYTKNSKYQKLGYSFFGAGFTLQILVFLLRTYEIKALPLNTLEELLSFLAIIISAVFYGFSFVYRKKLIEFGSLIAPLVMFLTAFSLPLYSETQNIYNNIWFYLHVSSLILSYGLIVFSSIAAILYILTDRDLKNKKLNSFFVSKFSSSLTLIQNLEHKSVILTFIFLSLGLIASSIWTAICIGKHWTWDIKQTMLFLLWIFYGFILHTRIIKQIKSRKASYLTLIGSLFAFIVFWLTGHPTFQ
jgi:ABC-type transport system involved in cytochrome c biogenesis permease subunit